MNDKKILFFLKCLSERKYNLLYIHIIHLAVLVSLFVSLSLFCAYTSTAGIHYLTAGKEALYSAVGTFSIGHASAYCFRKMSKYMKDKN